MHRRTRRTLWIVAAVLLLVALAIFLRSKAPPEAARLLPESDGIVYLNLKPIRAFLHKDLKPPQRVPEYQQFIDATGVDWERDLDQIAVALHRMPDPSGPNGPVAYSLVLVGKLNSKTADGHNTLSTWLDSHAASHEFYAGHTIYSIPSEGRTVRVAQIGYDMVAVSNYPTPEKIHSILDRHATAAWPFSGSPLLDHHYHDVPLLSVAWGVGQIALPFSESGAIRIFGLSLPLPADSTIIASLGLSLGWSGAVRVEELAPSEEAAVQQSASLATLLTLARGFTAALGANTANNALKELLETAVVTQKHNRVVVTASLSPASFASLAAAEEAPHSDFSNPAPNSGPNSATISASK